MLVFIRVNPPAQTAVVQTLALLIIETGPGMFENAFILVRCGQGIMHFVNYTDVSSRNLLKIILFIQRTDIADGPPLLVVSSTGSRSMHRRNLGKSLRS